MKLISFLSIVICLCLSFGALNAEAAFDFGLSCNLPYDTNTHSVPSISKPGYLSSITDPTFGSTVTRITGNPGTSISTGGTWGSNVHHQYSKVQAWNSDESIVFIETNNGSGGTGAVFLNGQTYAPLYSRSCPGSECRWSATVPSRMIYTSNNTIGYWDVPNNTTSTVATFAGYSNLTIGQYEGNLSSPATNMIVVTGNNSAGNAVAFAYNLSTGTKYADLNFTNLGISNDWASISPNGDYIVVLDSNDRTFVFNLSGTLVSQFTEYGRPSHYDLALDKDGNQVAIGVSKSAPDNGKVISRRLSDGQVTLITSGAYASHSSKRNALNLGWGISDYADNPGWPPYSSEIILYQLEGTSPKVYRVAHHHSNIVDYDSEVHASLSPSGTRVIFDSNWGSSSGPVQVYVADVRPNCSTYAIGNTNLLDNPGFENGFTSWTDWGNTVAETTDVYAGTASIRVGTGVGGRYQNVTSKLTVGSSYTLTSFAKTGSSGDLGGEVGIEFFNSSGTVIQDNHVQITATSYTQTTSTFTVPVGAVTALVYVYKSAGSSYLYADSLSLTASTASPAPTANLSASPTSINQGQSSALTWSSTNATSCTGTGFSTGGSTSGTLSVSPTSTTNYSVSCTGAGGTANANATVTVTIPAPTASLSASPTSINQGQSSTLTWSSTNATSCTGTGFSTGGSTSGSLSVSPTSTTNYSVSCTGAGGTANANTTVTVTAVNLINNPGFESNLSGWTNWGNSTRITSGQYAGAGGLRVGKGSGGRYQDVTASMVIGASYTLTAVAKTGSSSDLSGEVGIEFFNSSGTVIFDVHGQVTATSYTTYSNTFTVPVGAVTALVYAYKGSGSSYIYVDDYRLTRN